MIRFTIPEMMLLAARGLGRIDRDGLRGATLVSVDEIAAMAMLLSILGLMPVHPGACAPETHTPSTEGERE